MLKKKGIVSFPTRPDWGGGRCCKKTGSIPFPDSPPRRGTERVSRPGTEAWRGRRGFGAPISWRAPRCLADRRELHRWLAVTDNPPIEPIPVRHHLHSLGPPGQNSGSHLDERGSPTLSPISACPTRIGVESRTAERRRARAEKRR